MMKDGDWINNQAEVLAEEAKAEGNTDLAIVLYTYLGSEKLNMGSDFARHCQLFAREGIKEIEGRKNKRNQFQLEVPKKWSHNI